MKISNASQNGKLNVYMYLNSPVEDHCHSGLGRIYSTM